MFEVEDFYREIRRRNKEKFIALRVKQLETENSNSQFAEIPEYIQAVLDYDDFQKAGVFDCYGYIKPISR